ncbi:MAG: CPBP family glutamic-type intramembrane protease [Kiritimatiellia bacterium]
MLAGLGTLCLLTWPLLHFLWPYMALPAVEVSGLLSDCGLTGGTAWVFALYSVTIHPILEETFWRGMLPDHALSDALFAGFHVVVLAPLIHAGWLPVVFGVLWTASGIWRYLARSTGGLLLPVLTHAIADLGVLLAVRALAG